MNKRDAINHIRQFGGRLDRFRKSVGGSGDGGRNAPKRAKSSPKPVNRKTNVFNEQVRYAFHGALQDLKSKPFATFLTVMVIAAPEFLTKLMTTMRQKIPAMRLRIGTGAG